MGYACPVCDAPQIDARHLANHLAFTALLGDPDHETWLDQAAPGWEDAGPDALADRVADQAPVREFPQVFEDTVDSRADGDSMPDSPAVRGRAPPADDVQQVLETARALTRKRHRYPAAAAGTGSGESDDSPPDDPERGTADTDSSSTDPDADGNG